MDIKYLKKSVPRNLLEIMLVIEEIQVKIENIMGKNCGKQPEDLKMTIKKEEILFCEGTRGSTLYIEMQKEKKKIEISFKEFDRIKTLQVRDCVRISTPTGDQIGSVDEISKERDWITINNLRGTLEFPDHPAGDTIFVGIENIRAIASSFDEIYSDLSMKKFQQKKEFRESLKNRNLSEAEIEELVNFEFDKKTEQLSLADQIRRYYLKLKRDDLQSADRMLAEIGHIDECKNDVGRCYSIVRKYISGIVMYFQGERIL